MENNRFLSKFWNLKSISQQQQNEVGSKTPSFKPSLFTTGTSLQKDNPSTSSFYSGKVQFGGAMSAKHTASPYVVSKAKKISVSLKKDSQSSKSLKGSLSSTARKIFQTLEKMSTPLHDVRRIPPPSKNTSFFGRYNRKRPLGATFFNNSKKACAPSAGRTFITVSENASATLPLDNSLATHSIVQNASSNSKTASPSHIIYKGKPGVLASLSSSSGINLKTQAHKPAAGGGKMKNQRKSFGHYVASCKDTFENEVEAPNLPDITLNITSLPDFNFKKTDSTSTPAHSKFSSKELKNGKDILESQYTFALPNSVSLNKRRMPKDTLPNQVLFASKPVVQKHNHSETKFSSLISQKKTALKTSGSVMDILDKVVTEPTKTQEKSSSSKPSIGELFKKSSSQWECEVCMVMNDNDKPSCAACMTPKPSKSNTGSSDVCLTTDDKELTKREALKPDIETAVATTSETKGFSSNVSSLYAVKSVSKFSFGIVEPSAGTKESENESTVLSVQTKSTAVDAKVKAKSVAMKNVDKWVCDEGLIHNEKDKEKYAECENLSPQRQEVETGSAVNKPESKFKFKMSSVSPKWICNICLVPNDIERPTCIACNSANSQTEKSEVSGPSAFKFGSISSGMLKVGTSKPAAEAKSPASNSTAPALATKNKLDSPKLSDFKFGTSPSCSGAVAVSDKLQVSSAGNPLNSQSYNRSAKFGFGNRASQEDAALSHSGKVGFQFQAPSSEKKPRENISPPASNLPSLPASTDQISSRTSHENISGFSKSTQSFGTSMTTTALPKQPASISVKTTNPLLGKEQDDTKFSHSPFSGFIQEEKQISNVRSEPSEVSGNFSCGTTVASEIALEKDAKPMFSFGRSNTGAQKNSSHSAFGSTETTREEIKSEATNAGANALSFGFKQTNNSTSGPDVMNKPSSFSEFNPNSALKPDQAHTKTSAFAGFGQNASIPEERDENIDQTSKFSGFGQSTTSSGQSTFTFGHSTGAIKETKSTFSFEQSSGKAASSQTKSGFSFGSSTTPKDSVPPLSKPAFGFGTPVQAATSQATFGNNAFGGSTQLPAPATTLTNSGFQFGSSSNIEAQSNLVFGGTQTNSKPLFSFGSNANENANASNFQFGGQQSNALNAFSFGNNTNKNPAPSAGFHPAFSLPTKPTFSTAQKIPFQFGSNQSQAKPDSTTNTGFQFNASQQQANPFTPNALPNPGASAVFSIGQTGKSTPGRALKVAKRRLKK